MQGMIADTGEEWKLFARHATIPMTCLSGCLNTTPDVVGGSTAAAARDPHDRSITSTVKRRVVVSPVDRPRRRFAAWGESGARISPAVVGDWDVPRASSLAKPGGPARLDQIAEAGVVVVEAAGELSEGARVVARLSAAHASTRHLVSCRGNRIRTRPVPAAPGSHVRGEGPVGDASQVRRPHRAPGGGIEREGRRTNYLCFRSMSATCR